MRKLFRGLVKPSTLLPMVAMTGSTFLAAAQFVSNGALSIVTAAIAITVSTLIMIAYIPTLFYALRSRERPEEQNMLLGVVILFAAIEAWNMWRVAFTLLGQPEWMIGHWFPSLLSVIASLTGFYFLSVPGISRFGVRYTTMAIIGALALAAAGLMMFDSL